MAKLARELAEHADGLCRDEIAGTCFGNCKQCYKPRQEDPPPETPPPLTQAEKMVALVHAQQLEIESLKAALRQRNATAADSTPTAAVPRVRPAIFENSPTPPQVDESEDSDSAASEKLVLNIPLTDRQRKKLEEEDNPMSKRIKF